MGFYAFILLNRLINTSKHITEHAVIGLLHLRGLSSKNHSFKDINSSTSYHDASHYRIQFLSPVVAYKRPIISEYNCIPPSIGITFYRCYRRLKRYITYKHLQRYSTTKLIHYRAPHTMGHALFYYRIWANSDVYDQAGNSPRGQRLRLLSACRFVGLFCPRNRAKFSGFFSGFYYQINLHRIYSMFT